MNEVGVEVQEEVALDLDNLDPWLEKNITKPFPGFEDKKHKDGTPISFEEATEESRDQLRNMARDRNGVLEYKNQIRQRNGKPPLTQEDYDEDLKEDFLAIALETKESSAT